MNSGSTVIPERNPAQSGAWGHEQTPGRIASAALALIASTAPASASLRDLIAHDLSLPVPWLDPKTAMGFAIVMGLVIFSTTLAIRYVRERGRWTTRERAFAAELDGLRGAVDRAAMLLGSERQVVIVWNGRDGEPALEGDPTLAGEGAGLRRVLAFGAWLAPADAVRLEAAVERLRVRGESFHQTLRTGAGGYLEAEGRTVSGRALLRLRDVTGERAVLLRVEAEAADSKAALRAVRSLLDQVDEPIWLRRPDGGLAWANRAYCAAVEAENSEAVASRSLELLDSADTRASAIRRDSGAAYTARVAAVVAGSRRVLDVTEVPLTGIGGAGGIARDASALEMVLAEIALQNQAHVRMLDQLPNAVAMFDVSQRLVFHNAAYRQLWGLDAAFLDTRPSDGEILDHLRAARRLPEQADFRSWKTALFDAYRSAEAIESWWHLPDRRTLRVVTSPNPQGGLTYLFDDVSDRMQLESRFNALIRVQAETLDTLAEGVALFGSDGRLKLFNRAFGHLWKLDRAVLDSNPHIDAVVALGAILAPAETWADLKAAVAGLSDMRERCTVRLRRFDGSIVDGAAEPLPDGATLLTFVDVTATVNVERALTERNEALELAARLRNEFVHHVSYELRSPLTNVIGFAELLGAETVGPLNERQREYAGHITRSSGALLAIINDILDLASIDTDTVELAREPVDIRDAIEAAAAGIRDRLIETSLRLDIDVPPGIGSFIGDARRIRQVIYNLLSNAANFSRPGQTVRVTARKEDGEVILSVADQGRGIADEVKARVFERFESHGDGTARGGVGLGLSIVRSFVELHGGRVELVSERDSGTTVTCRLPAAGRPQRQLAAAMDVDEFQALKDSS